MSPCAARPLLCLMMLALLVACVPAAAPAPKPAPTSGAAAPAAAGAAGPAAAVSAPAASAPAAATAPAPPAPVNVKVGSLALVGEAALFVAHARGLFKEEGLEVEFVPFRTTNEVTAPLAINELQLASGAPDPALFNAALRGIDLRIVGYNAVISNVDTSGGLVMRQDHLDAGRYREPRDLKGMTMAVSAHGTIGQVWTERILAKGGLALDDVQLTTLTFPDVPAAMANRALDAAFVVEPFVAVAEGQGTARNVMPSGQIFPGLPAMVLMLGPVFAREQPEAAQRFVTAYLRGQRSYYQSKQGDQASRDEVYGILAQYTPVKEPRLFERMANHDVDPNGAMDPTNLETMQDYFVRYGTLQQRIDLSRLIDHSYMQHALDRLGRWPQ